MGSPAGRPRVREAFVFAAKTGSCLQTGFASQNRVLYCAAMTPYRYRRTDFKPLPVRLDHMDIVLRFFDDRVEGTNTLHITAREPMETVRLDARELDIAAVEFQSDGDSGSTATFDYRREDAALLVTLPCRLEPGDTFRIRAEAVCHPSDSILEGIYRDTTPPGCPPQYMCQCQQWGFQRILPVFDDCTAKCTMTTTLEGDARYTHLVSNGNISRDRNPDGKPVPLPGDPSRQVITYENPVPMAPYLFIAAAGTWEVLADEVVYPSGKHVKLEYLVPPGRVDDARLPMRILKDAVLWQHRALDYVYRHDVYRTICMEKSNFGGMENVGNTTIITSAALIDAFTGDRRLEYAYSVIIHEFEHNQCGSDVTMETPFDMWLNEAFTVDVERRYSAGVFDPDVVRLDEVDAMRAANHGPLAVEDGGHLGHIVREGFNHPDELVDGVTYVKAAEVIRMLRLILGAEAFRAGTDLYFSRHTGGNANTDQFFACLEEAGGRNLSHFRREWLHTIGYPKLTVDWAYDAGARQLTLNVRQARSGRGGLFHLPLAIAAVGAVGADIPGAAVVAEISGETTVLTLDNIPEPAFLSLNRDCSFYGTFEDRTSTSGQLRLQATGDPNGFNRVEAMRRLTDRERLKLIHDADAVIDEDWLTLYGTILEDIALPPGLKAYLLRIDEQSLDRSTLALPRERYRARLRLLRAVAGRHFDRLRRVFDSIDTYQPAVEPRDGIEERKLKAVLLRALIEADNAAAWDVAESHLRKARNFSDRAAALGCIDLSMHPRRREILDEAFALWKDHLNGYTAWLALIGAGRHDDVFERLAAAEARPEFRLEHPGHSRALFLPITANNKLLWTDRGLQWVADAAARLAPVNEYTAARMLACFGQVRQLGTDLKPRVLAALESVRSRIDREAVPTVAGRLDAYLAEPTPALRHEES